MQKLRKLVVTKEQKLYILENWKKNNHLYISLYFYIKYLFLFPDMTNVAIYKVKLQINCNCLSYQ